MPWKLGSPVVLLAVALIAPPRPAAAPKLVRVAMVDVSPTAYKFEPSAISASAGDTLRFTMSGMMPHNVEFRATPPGAALGAAKSGPYLAKAGDSYDLILDARFPAGEYQFVCVPHEALGMKATLTVAP